MSESRLKVDDSQPCVVRQGSVGSDEILERTPHPRLAGALTQRRDGGLAHLHGFCVGAGNGQQCARRGRLAHESERLDQACPACSIRRLSRYGQHRLQRDRQHISRGDRPLLERALREHSGESTALYQGDQAGERRESRQPLAERPGSVFVDVGARIVQQ